MSNITATPKRTNGADSAPLKHRHSVAFDDAEMATVRAAAKREHLPVATYMKRVVLKDAEACR